MSVNDVGNRVATDVYDALRWPYCSVSWFALYSYHASLICPSNPVENRKSEGGPQCSSMPFSTSLGVLRAVKCGYQLTRHRQSKFSVVRGEITVN